ncbi:MAG: DUF2723 domain-containing protein, partial [bacterium]|nr:DUF2723 domain-containing protein [bacterium]
MKLDNNRIGALITFGISLIVYTITTSPAVPFWDCGEFIASSVTMGVPHPPGAPLYLLAGKVFSYLPFPSDMAHKFNILAGIVSALTIMFLYLIIVRLIKEFVKEDNSLESKLKIYFAAGIGALTYAFTDTFWFNATEAEVYSISMLGVSMVMWFTLLWMDNYKELKSLKYLILISYLLGLSIGVHLLSFLVVPTIVILIYFHDKDMFMNLVVWGGVIGIFYILAKYIGVNLITVVITFSCVWGIYYLDKKGLVHFKLWGFVLALMVLGLSTYVSIYIRSTLGPVINENDPSTLEGFIKYWNREQYGSESLISTVFDRAAPFWTYQIKKMYLRYFAWNFIGKGTTLGADRYIAEAFSPKGLYYLPFLLGSFGVFYHFKKDWKRAFAVMATFLIMGLALVIYLNQPDPQPRERDYVYVGNFFAFAIWIGIGVTGLFDFAGKLVRKMPGVKNLAFGGIAGMVIIMGPFIEYKH